MGMLADISAFALGPVVTGIARKVIEAYAGKEAAEAVTCLVSRFADASDQLPQALSRAADRSWRALEVALAGESLLSKLLRRGEDGAFSAQVRGFLDAVPDLLPAGHEGRFRERCLRDLQAARRAGLVPGEAAADPALRGLLTDFARFADPVSLCDAEWRLAGQMARQLRQAGYTLGEGNRQIFANRYRLHLPTEMELAEEIRRELRHLDSEEPEMSREK